jgi:hypothetical protein
MIPDDACPICSHVKTEHNGLLDDVLVFPIIMHSAPQKDRKMRDGKFRVIGCPHFRDVFGPWESTGEANDAIADQTAKLREQCDNRCIELDILA